MEKIEYYRFISQVESQKKVRTRTEIFEEGWKLGEILYTENSIKFYPMTSVNSVSLDSYIEPNQIVKIEKSTVSSKDEYCYYIKTSNKRMILNVYKILKLYIKYGWLKKLDETESQGFKYGLL